MGIFKKEVKIVEGSGYTVASQEEVDAFYAQQQAADEAWEAEQAPAYEAQQLQRSHQRGAREQEAYEERSVWSKLTKGRFIPR